MHISLERCKPYWQSTSLTLGKTYKGCSQIRETDTNKAVVVHFHTQIHWSLIDHYWDVDAQLTDIKVIRNSSNNYQKSLLHINTTPEHLRRATITALVCCNHRGVFTNRCFIVLFARQLLSTWF